MKARPVKKVKVTLSNRKQWGGFRGNLSYPGSDNPKNYKGEDDYSYKPAEYYMPTMVNPTSN
jgi:hypothetical protein